MGLTKYMQPNNWKNYEVLKSYFICSFFVTFKDRNGIIKEGEIQSNK
jgi:hypothetical protein